MTFTEFLQETEMYETLGDLSEDGFEDLISTVLDGTDDALEEKLSILARKKKSSQMKRQQKKLQKAKALKAGKLATKGDIDKKARKAAIQIIRNKMTKGKTDLSVQDKERVEAKIQKMGAKITKIAKKQVKVVKKADSERRAAARAAKAGSITTKKEDT